MSQTPEKGRHRGAGRPGRWPWILAGGLAVLVVVVFGIRLAIERDGSEPETGDLVIMMDYDQSVEQQRHELIDEWADVTGQPVKIVEIPPSATAAHSQLVAHAQAAGDVDVYSLDLTWIAEFAAEEWIRPLERSTVNEESFLDAPRRAGEYDGELWALPFNTDAGLLFCNKRLLPGCDRAAVESWDDLIQLAGADGFQPAFAGQYADYEGFTVNVLEAILAHDPTALDTEEELAVTDATIDALNALAALFAEGAALPESLRHVEPDTTDAFAAGLVPFMRNWPVAYRQLTTAEEGDEPRMDADDVGVLRLPGPSVLGGQSLAVAATTDRPRAAQDLIEYLTSAASQEQLFTEGGFAPTQRAVYADPQLQAQFPYLADLGAAVDGARLRPVRPHYERFSEALRRIVRPHLEGDPAAPPLRQAELQAELDDALQGYRRA